MSDLISRQAAIEAFEKDIMGGLNWDYILAHLPSAQPEIIRCKDCKHYLRLYGCKHIDGMVTAQEDGFCSYAERKADG